MGRFTARGWIGFGWGVVGVSMLLLYAVVRLTPTALEALRGELGAAEVIGIAASLGFFGYVEGYIAFQKRFSPRVVARALVIASDRRWSFVVLAPAFCMGYFHATRKRQLVAWGLTTSIVMLVLIVRRVPQPWRGIVDLGVVVALSWGACAIVVFTIRALGGWVPPISADLPKAST